MSEQKPPAWFEKQTPNSADERDANRRKQLLEELPKLLAKQKDRGRSRSFYPYLLVRSVLGDRGDRSINVPFWESPDIWTAPGAPGSSPAVPANHGGTVVAGQPNTVYAHVWNLGLAPLAGIRVEFYWFNPSLSIDGTHAHLIGMARCELAGRGLPGSHALVKCPTAWVPVLENGGHECLVVRVTGVGDPLGANEWQPWLNRHVAQRNISVVGASTALKLVTSLNATRLAAGHLHLIQVSAKEGELALRAVAPGLRIAPAVQTHLLGELTAGNDVLLAPSHAVPTGMLAPVHPLAHGGAPAPPVMLRANEARVIDPAALLPDLGGLQRAVGTAHVVNLLQSIRLLHPSAGVHAPPAAGEAQALRLASYDAKGQLVGGYTLVVAP